MWKQVHVHPVHVSDEQWGLLQALSSATVSLTDEQRSGSVFRTASGQESIVQVRAGSARLSVLIILTGVRLYLSQQQVLITNIFQPKNLKRLSIYFCLVFLVIFFIEL